MTHLEALISEFLEWQGFLIRRNVKVGPLAHGGYEMELDVVGYNPETGELVQYEPSLDALSWAKREARYRKKFAAGKTHILKTLFPWVRRGRGFGRSRSSQATHPATTASRAGRFCRWTS